MEAAAAEWELWFSVVGKAGQMAADLDMEAPGGEGWGDDAELQLDEGKFTATKLGIIINYFNPDLFTEQIGPHHQYCNVV